MVKKILVLLCVALVLFSGHICASAVSSQTAVGEIRVKMVYEDEAVIGAELALYKIADIVEEDPVMVALFVGSGVKAEELELSTASAALAEYAQENVLRGKTQISDQQGCAVFSSLEAGVYLILQNGSVEGYYPISPFLICLPDTAHSEPGRFVEAAPKIAPEVQGTPAPNASETPSATSTPNPVPTPGEKLPQTGQLHWPVLVLVISGMILLTLGIYLRRGQKAGKHET